MHAALSQTFFNLIPQMMRYSHRVDPFVSSTSNPTHLSLPFNHTHYAGTTRRRMMKRHFFVDAQISSTHFEDFSVSTAETNDVRQLKISIEVSGNKTKRTFDDVFQKMVKDAQPIPGFRRVKGGKTPDIPENILLEVLGPSNVFKQVIKEIINSTVSEYVEQESLKVNTDMRVEQSFEDLETTFEAGEKFSFDVVLHLQK